MNGLYMVRLRLTDIEAFFQEENMDEAAQALFYLCPNEVKFYTWQYKRYRKQYEEKMKTYYSIDKRKVRC